MDQDILVSQAQILTRYLDQTRLKPKAVMWVYSEDTNTWRLWIVADAAVSDKREFYRIIAEVISAHSDKLHGLDISSIEGVSPDHPAMKGMRSFLKMPGLGSARFTGNRFNGFYLPDGVVVRMDL